MTSRPNSGQALSTTLSSLLPQATLPVESATATAQSWLRVRYRRGDAGWSSPPNSQSRRGFPLPGFLHALRLAIRSFRGHMSVLLARKHWTVELGRGVQRLPNGCLTPNERTIYRSQCIQELATRYPWASMVERTLFLEGFDKGELFARRTDTGDTEP